MSLIISFERDHAEKYGLEEAILLFHFRYWIEENKSDDRNLHDGRTWTYQSLKSLSAKYPFWDRFKLMRILKNLTSETGPLVKGNYNKTKYDHTLWYAFKDENQWIRDWCKTEHSNVQKCTIEIAKTHNRDCESAQPIPYNKPDDNHKDSSPMASMNPSTKREKINKKENPPTPKGEYLSFGSFVKLIKEDHEELSKSYGNTELDEVINEINDYLSSTGKTPYKDYAATIRNWFRRRIAKPSNSSSNASNFDHNKKHALEVVKSFMSQNPSSYSIFAKDTYVEIVEPNLNLREKVYYKDSTFKKDLEHYLKKALGLYA